MTTALNLESLRRVLSIRQPHALNDPSLTPAGVLLLLYPKSEGLCILLTKRTSKVEHHKGDLLPRWSSRPRGRHHSADGPS